MTKKVIALFDVDGTLTVPRQQIVPGMILCIILICILLYIIFMHYCFETASYFEIICKKWKNLCKN